MDDRLHAGQIHCEVDGRPFDLACLGCREMGYGRRSELPVYRFCLRLPESELVALIDVPCNDFLQTCREDDALFGESDVPALMQAGYPDVRTMLHQHRPLLAELLRDHLYRDLLDAILARSGARTARPRRIGDPHGADGRPYFTINALQKVAFADGELVLEGEGYFGLYIIWLKNQA